MLSAAELFTQATFCMLGGALGSTVRFLIIEIISQKPPAFPFGTFIVNVLGSLVIGALSETSLNPNQKAAFQAGILGGLTTMSSFALDTVTLAKSRLWLAAVYLVTTIVACIAAAFFGAWLVKRGK